MLLTPHVVNAPEIAFKGFWFPCDFKAWNPIDIREIFLKIEMVHILDPRVKIVRTSFFSRVALFGRILGGNIATTTDQRALTWQYIRQFHVSGQTIKCMQRCYMFLSTFRKQTSKSSSEPLNFTDRNGLFNGSPLSDWPKKHAVQSRMTMNLYEHNKKKMCRYGTLLWR